jgi:hypothetical protein
MVTQRIANPYDQHTLHSKVPVKESIILQSNLQAISWDPWAILKTGIQIFLGNFLLIKIKEKC